MSPSDTVSPAKLLVGKPQKRISLTHKLVLLLIFCFANFLDVFNNGALFPAVPVLESSMGITQSQSAWLISAFQLTFASFLLIVCRVASHSRHHLTRTQRADGSAISITRVSTIPKFI